MKFVLFTSVLVAIASAGKVTCSADLAKAALNLNAAKGEIDAAAKNCIIGRVSKCTANLAAAKVDLVEANTAVVKMDVDCAGSIQ